MGLTCLALPCVVLGSFGGPERVRGQYMCPFVFALKALKPPLEVSQLGIFSWSESWGSPAMASFGLIPTRTPPSRMWSE